MSDVPLPITDLAGLSARVQRWLPTLLPALARPGAGGMELWKDFSGGWRARARLPGGVVEFALLRTPGDGILAWPTPLPPQFMDAGVPASDGTRWVLDRSGRLVSVPLAVAPGRDR